MMAPWEESPHIWKTKAAFMSWVRGGIRRGLWEKHPVKLEYMGEQTFKIVNTNPRSMKAHPMVNASRCAICGVVEKITVEKKNYFEVDHMTGNHSLRSMDDLRAFVEAMLFVTKADLQIVCKPCHKVKSYAEKEGISFELAFATKEAIAIQKDKKDSTWLKDAGIMPASSAPKRRAQIIDKLMEEKTCHS